MSDERYKQIIADYDQKMEELEAKYPKPLTRAAGRQLAQASAPVRKELAKKLAELEPEE